MATNPGPGDERWASEISRETEHYYQAEAQQEQRASWLLAASSALIAIVGGIAATGDKGTERAPRPLLIAAVGLLGLSAVLAAVTVTPLRGVHAWSDLSGSWYRRLRTLAPEALIRERFRVTEDWQDEDYSRWIIHHFRSHLLRSYRKAYGVMYSVVTFVAGAVLLLIASVVVVVRQ